MISVKECFDKGLLKKGEKSLELAKKDLKQSEFFLKETEDLFEIGKKYVGILSLYNAYFHCLRALLFKDGIKERSHYCLLRYFEENYVNKKLVDVKYLNSFETLMSLRHNVQYSTEIIDIDEDLDELFSLCQTLIDVIGKLL